MIKVRAEERGILLWNPKTSGTALLTGEELEVLDHWARGGAATGFIHRLKQLKLIEDTMKEDIIAAIRQSSVKKAPLRSFSAPESLHIELTARCPLSCPQCYKGQSPKDLPFEILKKAIHQAAENQVFQVALGGGEPLLYPYLAETVSMIHHWGMSSSITTSGTGLQWDLLQTLIHAGLNHMQVSLNGSTEKVHSCSRDGFLEAIHGLSLLSETSLSYGINWVARLDNINDFPDLVILAKKTGANNINIIRYKPSVREHYNDICLTKEKTLQLKHMIQNTKEIGIKLDSAFSSLLCGLNKRGGYLTGCGAGRRFIALDAEGFLRPCSHVGSKETWTDLLHYWNSSEALDKFRHIEDHITTDCHTCCYLSECRGCRAITANQNSNFFAGEQDCFLRKGRL